MSSFGGPIAHLGYFHEEFVVRRRWVDEATYTDLVALCQFLPGPVSSQVGFSIGLMRTGIFGRSRGMGRFHAAIRDCTGALCARGGRTRWPDRCRPFAWPQARCGRGCRSSGLGHGAHAVYWLGASINRLRRGADRSFSRLFGDSDRGYLVGRPRRILALPSPNTGSDSGNGLSRFAPRRLRNAYDFFFLLIGLPLLRGSGLPPDVAQFNAFYRSSALMFGGGHVVLPLLREAFVAPGWVSDDIFLIGYGAAQAVPGPLFTFAAYLGAVEMPSPHGVAGAALGLVGIFLPSVPPLVVLVYRGTLVPKISGGIHAQLFQKDRG